MITKNIAVWDIVDDRDGYNPEEFTNSLLDLVDLTGGQILEPPRYSSSTPEVLYLFGWPTVEDYRSFNFWYCLHWPKVGNIEIYPEDFWYESEPLTQVQTRAAHRKFERKYAQDLMLHHDISMYDKKYIVDHDYRDLLDAKFHCVLKSNGIIINYEKIDKAQDLLDLLRNGPRVSNRVSYKELQRKAKLNKKIFKQFFKEKACTIK